MQNFLSNFHIVLRRAYCSPGVYTKKQGWYTPKARMVYPKNKNGIPQNKNDTPKNKDGIPEPTAYAGGYIRN